MIEQIFVADTNILSYVFNAHPLAQAYRPILATNAILISFVTVLEMRYGAYKARWGSRRLKDLETYLSAFTIVHSNDDICTECARLLALSHHQGHAVAEADVWIAATASVFDIPLVTHNKKHFGVFPHLTLISEDVAGS
jgi:tRNA(fMet)-specific endonuclease VapC